MAIQKDTSGSILDKDQRRPIAFFAFFALSEEWAFSSRTKTIQNWPSFPRQFFRVPVRLQKRTGTARLHTLLNPVRWLAGAGRSGARVLRLSVIRTHWLWDYLRLWDDELQVTILTIQYYSDNHETRHCKVFPNRKDIELQVFSALSVSLFFLAVGIPQNCRRALKTFKTVVLEQEESLSFGPKICGRLSGPNQSLHGRTVLMHRVLRRISSFLRSTAGFSIVRNEMTMMPNIKNTCSE